MILIQGALAYPVTKLVVPITARIASAPLKVATAQFDDVRVAHGTATVDRGTLAGQKLQLVVTERAGELPKAALGASDGAGGLKVHPAEFSAANSKTSG
jgi:hypothetical protein